MSSHHVIREAQEPALIIANGEACNSELMDQLLEWSPFIVVLDGALQRVLELQIKFDVVLGDFDGFDPEEIRAQVPPSTQVVHMPDQEKTDLEKGLDYLISNNHKAVNIIWASGRRSDHYMNNIAVLGRYIEKITTVMIDNHSRIYPIQSGFTKHFAAGTNVSLIPLNKVSGVISSNLVWNLNNEILEYPHRTSSSNRVQETGPVNIQFESGILLMMECLDL